MAESRPKSCRPCGAVVFYSSALTFSASAGRSFGVRRRQSLPPGRDERQHGGHRPSKAAKRGLGHAGIILSRWIDVILSWIAALCNNRTGPGQFLRHVKMIAGNITVDFGAVNVIYCWGNTADVRSGPPEGALAQPAGQRAAPDIRPRRWTCGARKGREGNCEHNGEGA